MPNYILFVAQEGNFQTRSMLIPAEEFLSVRKNDYDLLKNKKIRITNGTDVVDNVVLENYVTCSENSRVQEENECNRIVTDLKMYCEWGLEHGYSDTMDKEWYDGAIMNLCDGFDNIANYTESMTIKNINGMDINIIDSFLVLETIDGKISHQSKYRTVEEMMQDVYE